MSATENARRLPIPAAPWTRLPAGVPSLRGAYRVWQRNRDTFLRLWRTDLWPPFLEAVMNLVAFGFGIGGYVQQAVEGLPYLQYVAPGIVLVSGMFSAFFECTFGAFIRMQFQKTYEAIIATPVNIEDVITGEVLWGATRAVTTATSVLLVLAVLGLTPSPWALLVPLVVLLFGGVMSALAMIATTVVPSINSFSYFLTLGLTPMWLFSGVFFSVDRLPDTVRWVPWLSPLYHAVQIGRGLTVGRLSPDMLGDALWLLVVGICAFAVAVILGRRRMIT
ncbi:MAG TPA: ABC transporter permease [Chloroflexia bacterium]|nr:ABC transporter permease [Chloroflexia bacterium]